MAETTRGFWRILSNPALYEKVQYFLGAKDIQRKIIDDVIKPRQGERVLDIGCGTGEIVKFFPPVTYVGLDYSSEYIKAAKKQHGDCGSFYCDDVCNLPNYYTGNFDLVMAFGVLHHLDDTKAQSLFETARKALNKGGRLITVDPVYFKGQGLLDRFLTTFDRGRDIRSDKGYVTLAESYFSKIQTYFIKGNLPMPRSGIVLRCEGSLVSDGK